MLYLIPFDRDISGEQYIKDPLEKDQLFDAIHTMPAVRDKARWAVQWMNREASFAERLVAFAAVEGILFSGSFCAPRAGDAGDGRFMKRSTDNGICP
eukprot:Skav214060  [mRNA]  locus=scaffold2017:668027:669607:+ [translate_table: standard]